MMMAENSTAYPIVGRKCGKTTRKKLTNNEYNQLV